MSRTKKILFYLVLPPLLFIVASALVIFFYLQFHKAPELDLTAKGFSLSAIEINEGETIHFVNQSNVTQILCLGLNATCDAGALAPRSLKTPGLQLQPGAAIDIAFEQYGTYNITSTSVRDINLKVTVDPAA